MTNKSKKKIVVKVRKGASRPGKQTASKPKKTKTTVIGSLMRAGGSALGAYFGGAPGAALGRMAGGFVSKITGQGAYKVQRNSLMNGQIFTFANNTDGELILKRRERIGAVLSSTSFSIQSFELNPGLVDTCPWGSGVAQLYEQYQYLGAVLEFKSTSGSFNGTTQALGAIYFATEYDPDRAVYANATEMMTSLFAQECKPNEDLLHPVECKESLDPFGNKRYVRTAETTSDKRFTDLGRISIATEGQSSANVQLGELWLTYEVKLFKPLYSGAVLADKRQYITGFLGTNNTSWFGTSPLSYGQSYATCTINAMTFNETGVFMIVFKPRVLSAGTFSNHWSPAYFSSVDCTPAAASAGIVGATSSSLYAPQSGETSSSLESTIQLTVTAVGAILSMPTATWSGGTWYSFEVMVTKVGHYSASSALLEKRKVILSQDEIDREFQQLMIVKFKKEILGHCASDAEDYNSADLQQGTSVQPATSTANLGHSSLKLGPQSRYR